MLICFNCSEALISTVILNLHYIHQCFYVYILLYIDVRSVIYKLAMIERKLFYFIRNLCQKYGLIIRVQAFTLEDLSETLASQNCFMKGNFRRKLKLVLFLIFSIPDFFANFFQSFNFPPQLKWVKKVLDAKNKLFHQKLKRTLLPLSLPNTQLPIRRER